MSFLLIVRYLRLAPQIHSTHCHCPQDESE